MEKLIDLQYELRAHRSLMRKSPQGRGASKLSIALMQSALKILDGKWAKFETQHVRLRAEFGDRLEDHDCTREDLMGEVEATYLQQRAELLEMEGGLGKAVDSGNQDVKAIKSEASALRNMLPRIQLPQFSGKFEEWPAFRDLFRSIITEEASLSKVEKMHYLKTNVKGDAKKLIRDRRMIILSEPGKS